MLTRGIPHRLRRQVWLRCCKAAIEQAKVKSTYAEIVACSATRSLHVDERHCEYVGQVLKDLLRTFPTNVFFSKMDDEGIQRL